MARSPESYEREIRSLESRLSEECANSLRLAQELAEARRALDDLALREHLVAHPTPPSGLPPIGPSKTTVFRKRDGSPLIEITLTRTFSKLRRAPRRRNG